jgi:hypothetical protein
MTEAEWLACEDIVAMARFLQDKPCDTVRRWRLFTVACYNSARPFLYDHEQNLVPVLERYADGLATIEEWYAVLREQYLHEFHSADAAEEGCGYTDEDAAEYALAEAEVLASRCPYAELDEDRRSQAEETVTQSKLLRDIFNPFPPVVHGGDWQSPTVRKLAESIYADRAFDRLPLLADALEDAGCTDADILAHCRGPGPHVRGCWVVDLLLGKQ